MTTSVFEELWSFILKWPNKHRSSAFYNRLKKAPGEDTGLPTEFPRRLAIQYEMWQ
jgi:hypothetical protein